MNWVKRDALGGGSSRAFAPLGEWSSVLELSARVCALSIVRQNNRSSFDQVRDDHMETRLRAAVQKVYLHHSIRQRKVRAIHLLLNADGIHVGVDGLDELGGEIVAKTLACRQQRRDGRWSARHRRGRQADAQAGGDEERRRRNGCRRGHSLHTHAKQVYTSSFHSLGAPPDRACK